MRLDSLWIKSLAKKYGKKHKVVRDMLWPDNPTQGLNYFDKYSNPTLDRIEIIADAIGCSVDELLRRDTPIPPSTVTGNNNQVGNVHINSDVKSLNEIISAQKKLIEHQEAEIKRISASAKEQLKAKDAQIDRLIKLAQRDGNQ